MPTILLAESVLVGYGIIAAIVGVIGSGVIAVIRWLVLRALDSYMSHKQFSKIKEAQKQEWQQAISAVQTEIQRADRYTTAELTTLRHDLSSAREQRARLEERFAAMKELFQQQM